MAIIWEDDIDDKLSFKIESVADKGNILKVINTATGEVKAQTQVGASNPRIAAKDEEVAAWTSIAKSLVK